MLSRLVLGYLIALPAVVPLIATSIGGTQRYALVVEMSATAPGPLQVFYDTGGGFNETQSAIVPLKNPETAREYQIALPPGEYRQLRIDPGIGAGLYLIRRVTIRTGRGTTHTTIPLADLIPAHQVVATERSSTRLLLKAQPGSTDPQLLYAPAHPLSLPSEGPFWLTSRVALLLLCGFLLVYLAERALRPLAPTATERLNALSVVAETSPRVVIVTAALLSTMLATYPLLFLGRSLVSPNNHGLPMLYDAPPFVPGSADLDLEDVRSSDVGAIMWAFVPYSVIQRESLSAGEMPLWNRYNAIGRPLWGQGQTFLLDPLHWLTLLSKDPALGWDLKFVAHRFVFAAGVGLAALVVTNNWIAAAIAGAAAPFAGVYVYRFNHPAVFSLTYAPWVLLASFRLASEKGIHQRVRAWILLVVTTSLVLVSSPPKEAIGMLLGIAIVGAAAALLSPFPWRQRIERLMAGALAALAAVLVTAPHWLIFLTTLRQSFTFYETPYAHFADVSDAVGFFLGPLKPGPTTTGLHLLALVLTIAVLAAPRRLVESRTRLACAFSAAVLLAVGFGAVPASWLIGIPLLGNVGHIDDVFLTASLPLLLVLTAAGAEALLTAGRRRALVVVVSTVVIGWWLVGRVRGMAPPGSFEPFALLVLLPLALAWPGCLIAARESRHKLLSIGAAAAVTIALLLPGGLHGRLGVEALDRILLQPRLRAPLGREAPVVEAIHRTAIEPTRTLGMHFLLLPGSQALYQLESLGGPDALEVRAYERLVDAAGIHRAAGWHWVVVPADLDRLAPFLDMLNVGFLLVRPEDVLPSFPEVSLAREDRVRAVLRPTAWPRAFFVDRVGTYANPADLMRQVREHGKPFAAVDPGDALAVGATRGLSAPADRVVPATGYLLAHNSTKFRVRTTGAGVAVLGEAFLAEDFLATLNGRPVNYFRVNEVFKAVVIPGAGDWEVRFEYRPARWTEAWLTALAGVLLLCGTVVASEISYRRVASSSEYPAARASS